MMRRTRDRLFKPLLEDLALRGSGHINAPAGELGGQARVLAILADGQGELFLLNRDQGGVIRFAQLHFQWLDRAERVRDEGGRIGTPLDDIYLLIVEFMHDIVNTRAAHADTRTDRVQPFLARDNRYFRAASWFACDGLDLHGALVNLGNLGFEETAYQVAMRAGDQDLQHAPLRASHIVDIHAQALPGAVALGRHLFSLWHQSLHALGLVKVQQPAAHGIAPGQGTQADLAHPVL